MIIFSDLTSDSIDCPVGKGVSFCVIIPQYMFETDLSHMYYIIRNPILDVVESFFF